MDYQLASPRDHRINYAERAIQIYKNHFISTLQGADPDYPDNCWDLLMPQINITLNLLRQSKRDPTKSAYEVLNEPFNYDSTPLAPPGCKTIAFESPQSRKSFAPHGIAAWYI